LVYVAIRDLDEDLEVGKLSEVDHSALRTELRAQAIALLEEERRAAEAPVAPAGPKASDRCPHCRAAVSQDAVYCSQCGAHLGRERAESAG
jgi:Zn finger protein HypA/HybF involved in hydrogenase expression